MLRGWCTVVVSLLSLACRSLTAPAGGAERLRVDGAVMDLGSASAGLVDGFLTSPVLGFLRAKSGSGDDHRLVVRLESIRNESQVAVDEAEVLERLRTEFLRTGWFRVLPEGGTATGGGEQGVLVLSVSLRPAPAGTQKGHLLLGVGCRESGGEEGLWEDVAELAPTPWPGLFRAIEKNRMQPFGGMDRPAGTAADGTV